MTQLFLDANAHLPLNIKAKQAYLKFSDSIAGYGHPSSLASPGRQAMTALEEARIKIAELIGAQNSNQIIFTSNCTQACAWGMKLFLDLDVNNLDAVAISPMEHPAVKHLGERLQVLPCDEHGIVTGVPNQDIKKIICLHMQNEIGTIQPITSLKTQYLFSDLSQSLGKIPLNVQELAVDIGVFGAHKFGGPGGVGFMYLKDTAWWQPYEEHTGYFLDRPGTPDVAGIVATAVALEEAIKTLPERTTKMQQFQTTLENGLQELGLEIIGHSSPRSPNTTFVGGLTQAQNTLLKLSEQQIHVGLGSACSSYHTNVSPLMKVLNKSYTIDQVMRISQWGEYGETEAHRVLYQLKKIGKI